MKNEKNHYKVFLFDEEQVEGRQIESYLQQNGFQVDRCYKEEEAYKIFKPRTYHICILCFDGKKQRIDSAFRLAENIRYNDSRCVMLLLSGYADDHAAMVEAYSLHADLYLRKTVSSEELLARLNNFIHRVWQGRGENACYQVGRYRLNCERQTLSFDGQTARITTKECDLMHYLCAHLNGLSRRKDLLLFAWNANTRGNARSLDVYINRLRHLLAGDKRIHLLNVHGLGYELLFSEAEEEKQ
ncbi:MAG: response regulator transcription factor [Tannerella sp.]|jgi:DNA-binding response OmpR family regulator|nr:response regulator transcription factor [Tannerella sp.]